MEMGLDKGAELDVAAVMSAEGEKRRQARASKISHLQTKVRQLQSEIRRRDRNESGSNFQSSRDKHVDIEAAKRIQAMEKQRREAVEQITEELLRTRN